MEHNNNNRQSSSTSKLAAVGVNLVTKAAVSTLLAAINQVSGNSLDGLFKHKHHQHQQSSNGKSQYAPSSSNGLSGSSINNNAALASFAYRSGVPIGGAANKTLTPHHSPFKQNQQYQFTLIENVTADNSSIESIGVGYSKDHNDVHYDYDTSFIQWVIICSTILAIALGFATILYVRKATNWDARSKMRKLVKQRKLEFVENRRIRRVRTKWQTPEDFLATYIEKTQIHPTAATATKSTANSTAAGGHNANRRKSAFAVTASTIAAAAGGGGAGGAATGSAGSATVSKQLYFEYENIRRRPLAGTYNYTSLKAFELAEKNVIKECLPYDHNRITLPLDPSVPCSDYINGSFVDGYSSPSFYLTIQGPFEASIVDFWRVVWLYKVRCIVMLCEPFEFAARQCFRYWPDKSMSYDDIEVRQDFVHRTLDFTYRKFTISHAASNDRLEVLHFQYKNWPQFGLPDVYTFLHFVYLVRAYNPEFKQVVVHSKTGSCRTGLYIAIDYCLESICSDNIVNIHECVRRIRRNRVGLVSTIEQYEFIYLAVRVFLLCGITEVPLKSLPKFVHLLNQPMNGLPKRGFEQQYDILAKLRRNLTQNDSATGIMSENRWVSRDATCLPPDEYRAHLITGRKGCHDYINAVICNSYLRANAFIVTQWPLLTTMKDFWRMVYDYGIVSTIVLSDVSTGLRYPKFWPVKRGKRQLFDVVSVNLEAKDKRIWGTEYSYTMRQWEGFVDMKAVLMKAGESAAAVPKGEGRTLSKWISKLFVLNGWRSTAPTADRSESIIQVLLEIEKWQREAGPDKFICVVSTDGVEQCGVFMTLYMAHQQMINDFKVDIMATALAIRRTRPQLLPTQDEYEYCWRLAAELQQHHLQTVGGQNIPDVHQSPIAGLCSRCWYCKNKAQMNSIVMPLPMSASAATAAANKQTALTATVAAVATATTSPATVAAPILSSAGDDMMTMASRQAMLASYYSAQQQLQRQSIILEPSPTELQLQRHQQRPAANSSSVISRNSDLVILAPNNNQNLNNNNSFNLAAMPLSSSASNNSNNSNSDAHQPLLLQQQQQQQSSSAAANGSGAVADEHPHHHPLLAPSLSSASSATQQQQQQMLLMISSPPSSSKTVRSNSILTNNSSIVDNNNNNNSNSNRNYFNNNNNNPSSSYNADNNSQSYSNSDMPLPPPSSPSSPSSISHNTFLIGGQQQQQQQQQHQSNSSGAGSAAFSTLYEQPDEAASYNNNNNGDNGYDGNTTNKRAIITLIDDRNVGTMGSSYENNNIVSVAATLTLGPGQSDFNAAGDSPATTAILIGDDSLSNSNNNNNNNSDVLTMTQPPPSSLNNNNNNNNSDRLNIGDVVLNRIGDVVVVVAANDDEDYDEDDEDMDSERRLELARQKAPLLSHANKEPAFSRRSEDE